MSGWQQLAVLGLGSFLGFICKGATGFGSAVLLVASWVIANMAGVDAGQAFACVTFVACYYCFCKQLCAQCDCCLAHALLPSLCAHSRRPLLSARSLRFVLTVRYVAGPLQVVVLLDAVTSLVMSVPLLYLVNVWQHFRSSYKLSAIVLLFTVRAAYSCLCHC